jgi:hypothetical protein
MRAPSPVVPAAQRRARNAGLLRDPRLEIGTGSDGQLVARFVAGVSPA